jgi:hypothetical protein
MIVTWWMPQAPFGAEDQVGPMLVNGEVREARKSQVTEDFEGGPGAVHATVLQADVTPELDSPGALDAARVDLGRVALGVLAVQGEERDALAFAQLVADVAPEGKAVEAVQVDQRLVVDAHQLDGAALELHDAHAGAPGMATGRTGREPEGDVAFRDRMKVAHNDEGVVDAEEVGHVLSGSGGLEARE